MAPFGSASASLTTLKITPSVDIAGSVPRPAGVEFEVTLTAGQIYYLQLNSNGTGPAIGAKDLTGTIIKSNHPVAVLSGATAAGIEHGYPSSLRPINHLVEQLPSVDQHDTEFLVAPLAERSRPGLVRIVASRNNTVVTGATAFPQVIHRGDLLEVNLTAGQGKRITASKPILVAQFAESGANGTDGDPSFVIVPGVNSLGPKATLTVADLPRFTYAFQPTLTRVWTYHATVFAPTASVGQVTRNGVTIPATDFFSIPGSSYSFARIQVTPGKHEFVNLANTSAIGAFGYGKNFYDSFCIASSENYTYVGGPSAAPNTPTGLTATTQQDPQTTEWSVNLSWTDNSTNEEGFILDRRNSSTASWTRVATLAANATSYSDTGAPADATVSYRVRAISDLNSAFSNVADAPTPPHAPTATTSWFDAHNSVRILWTDGSSVETGFDILRKTTSGAWAVVGTVSANILQYTDTSTQPLTTYQYTIRAKRDALVSATSNVLSGQTPDIPPLAPTISATAVSDTQINVSVTGGLRSTGAYLYRRESGTTDWTAVQNFTISAGVTVGPIAVTGLDGLTQYEFKAHCNNSGGISPDATASATTLMPPPPVAPTNLVAKALYDDEVKLTWEDNATNEKKYIVQRRLTGGTTWTTVTANVPKNSTSYNDRTVAGNTDYTYRVAASNAGGDAWSNESAAKTPVTPVAHTPYLSKIEIPEDLIITSGTTTGYVEISRRSGTPMYVELSAEVGHGVEVPTSVTIPAGERRASFDIVVDEIQGRDDASTCSVNASSGAHLQSTWLSIVTSPSQLQLTDLTAQGVGGGVCISFTGLPDELIGASISGYEVARIDIRGFQVLGRGTTSSFLDHNALPGVSTTYIVSVLGADGTAINSSNVVGTAQPLGQLVLEVPSGLNSLESMSLTGNISPMGYLFVDGWQYTACYDATLAAQNEEPNHFTVDKGQFPIGSHTAVALGTTSVGQTVSNVVTFAGLELSERVESRSLGLWFEKNPMKIDYDFGAPSDTVLVQIMDSLGQPVKSWSVLGGQGQLSWDGSLQSGAQAPEGQYSLKATKGALAKQSKGARANLHTYPEMLVLMYNGDNEYLKSTDIPTPAERLHAHNKSVEFYAESLKDAMAISTTIALAQDFNFNAVPITFSGVSGISTDSLAELTKVLKMNSLSILLAQGHGNHHPALGSSSAGMELGRSVALVPSKDSGIDAKIKQVDLSEALGNRKLSFAVFDFCFGAGRDIEHLLSGYAEAPRETNWANCVNLQSGGYLALNGAGYVNSNTWGQRTDWFYWRRKLYQELSKNLLLSDALTTSFTIPPVPYPSPQTPWDSWEFGTRKKVEIFGDARILP
jgi:hypothetical protein